MFKHSELLIFWIYFICFENCIESGVPFFSTLHSLLCKYSSLGFILCLVIWGEWISFVLLWLRETHCFIFLKAFVMIMWAFTELFLLKMPWLPARYRLSSCSDRSLLFLIGLWCCGFRCRILSAILTLLSISIELTSFDLSPKVTSKDTLLFNKFFLLTPHLPRSFWLF